MRGKKECTQYDKQHTNGAPLRFGLRQITLRKCYGQLHHLKTLNEIASR